MEATAVWKGKEGQLMSTLQPNGPDETQASHDKIRALKQLAFRLLREVQSIGEVHTLDLESGLDFYQEVSRFEIDLIKRALLQTGGHQGRAARLLSLKVTTLNSKIKHYNINLDGLSAYLDSETPTRQHA
jgi:transcriptional regulator with GAF, ATPase, and Fis domain